MRKIRDVGLALGLAGSLISCSENLTMPPVEGPSESNYDPWVKAGYFIGSPNPTVREINVEQLCYAVDKDGKGMDVEVNGKLFKIGQGIDSARVSENVKLPHLTEAYSHRIVCKNTAQKESVLDTTDAEVPQRNFYRPSLSVFYNARWVGPDSSDVALEARVNFGDEDFIPEDRAGLTLLVNGVNVQDDFSKLNLTYTKPVAFTYNPFNSDIRSIMALGVSQGDTVRGEAIIEIPADTDPTRVVANVGIGTLIPGTRKFERQCLIDEDDRWYHVVRMSGNQVKVERFFLGDTLRIVADTIDSYANVITPIVLECEDKSQGKTTNAAAVYFVPASIYDPEASIERRAVDGFFKEVCNIIDLDEPGQGNLTARTWRSSNGVSSDTTTAVNSSQVGSVEVVFPYLTRSGDIVYCQGEDPQGNKGLTYKVIP